MKTAPGIDLKLRAARTKLKAFKRSARIFGESNPYEVRGQIYRNVFDPSYYRVSLYLCRLKRPPALRWTTWVDEITYHLRSALDAAVYDLSRSPERPNPCGTYFPIAIKESEFKQHGIRYLTDDQRAFIKSTQPYGRRDDPLWLLHEINRLNKHRVVQFSAILVTPNQEDLSNHLHFTVSDLELRFAAFRPVLWGEDGTELASLTYSIIGPDPKVEVKLSMQTDIKFSEPALTSTWHVGILMDHILAEVEDIISTLYSLPR